MQLYVVFMIGIWLGVFFGFLLSLILRVGQMQGESASGAEQKCYSVMLPSFEERSSQSR